MRLPFSLAFWDKFVRSLVLAARSLWLHKLRAILSVLGIIIGTGAVISLMAFGEGSMHDALEDIKRAGATNIIVRSVKPPDDSATSQRGFVTTYGLVQRDLNKSGKTIIMVPHENDIAAWARRVVRLRDGRVESDVRNDARSIVEMGH